MTSKFAGLLWISLVCVVVARKSYWEKKTQTKQLFRKPGVTLCLVHDNFTCIIEAGVNKDGPLFVFLQEHHEYKKRQFLPKLSTNGPSYLLHLERWLTRRDKKVYFLHGDECKESFGNLTGDTEPSIHSKPNSTRCDFHYSSSVVEDGAGAPTNVTRCEVRCFHLNTICANSYDKDRCVSVVPNSHYVIDVTAKGINCGKCRNPVNKPEENVHLGASNGTQQAAADTVNLMNEVIDLAPNLNGFSAAVSGGDGIEGAIMVIADSDDAEEVSFAYTSPNDSLSIVTESLLGSFPRSVTVPKEAFEKAFESSTFVFAAVLRFTNFAQDAMNSTILDNEVLAVEMGAKITNLTDKIGIHFKNVKYDGIPSCRSWNSEGVLPLWTDDGCETVISDDHVTCQCSHLTFFAILLIPLNQTEIPISDLNNLTIITQVGCGVSMFFLSIALFMHYLFRRTKATNTTKILIHLLWAMLLLNLTFLTNGPVSNLNHSVGCKIMAAAMHYFMLATFTWFAVQAFHICLQMHAGGKVLIKRYVLKVSVASWGIPSVVVIVLLSVGKYGQQVIHEGEGANKVTMCWITDGDVHYIVNIGFYALIFLFTFSTLVVIMTWFVCFKRTNSGTPQGKTSGMNVTTVMGLCCLLGVTWGFAFFAYGVLRLPSFYIFSVLNSFQGFFLFIYYYKNSNLKPTSISPSVGSSSSSSSTTTTTTTTTLGKGHSFLENPYNNFPEKKPQASEDG